jgi:hypothetical protein
MYSWIWRRLPGPLPARLAAAIGLMLVTAAVLWLLIFPWAYAHVPLDSVGFAG